MPGSYYYGDYDPLAGITVAQHDAILAVGTGALPANTTVSVNPPQPPSGGYEGSLPTFGDQTTWDPSRVGQQSAAPASPAPSWTYAVNMPSTYPDFAAMKATGQGLVVASDDPNAAMLVAGARAWGVSVAIQVFAPNDITPEQYAARVAAAKATFNPDQLVLDIEHVGKGYEGSTGWNWSEQAAGLLKDVVGSTAVAVTMEPNQADYNYNAYQGLSAGGSTQFWVQAYQGDMTAYDPNAATAPALAAGVSPNQLTVIVGPNQQAPTGSNYASYGIPQNQFGGIYGDGTQYPAGTPPPSNIPGLTPVPTGTQYPVRPTLNPDGTIAKPTSATDFASAYFGGLGLPADIVTKVNAIFQKYPDTDQAIQFALAFIRSTPWYAQTFPGIQYGIQHGIITDERDYRQYVTAIDIASMQYFGRHISGPDITAYLAEGLSPDIVGRRFLGEANVQAYGGEYRYYLGAFGEGNPSDSDLTALGREQAGLDSALGQKLKRSLDTALQRFSKMFEGQSASPSLSLGNTGLVAPSLGASGEPDIAR